MRWAAHLKGCVLTAALKGTYKPNSHTFLNTKPLLAVSGNQDIALSLSLGLSEKGKKINVYASVHATAMGEALSDFICGYVCGNSTFQTRLLTFGMLCLIYLCADDKSANISGRAPVV